MKNVFFLPILFTLFISFSSCKGIYHEKNSDVQLVFLDEYILHDSTIVNGSVVGGLSGIDYQNDHYYLVSDDASNPRFYRAKIVIESGKIISLDFESEIQIKDSVNFLDLESIRTGTIGNVYLTSEGHINKGEDPSFFMVDTNGKIKYFNLPDHIKANSIQRPRHNGTLEGLTRSYDGNGFWLAMELPLGVDGPEPQPKMTKSPVRVFYIDMDTGNTKKEFAYLLDSVAKEPKGNFSVNGLTEILMYNKDKFFIVERSYSSGWGNQGNTVKIFDVDASKATNILRKERLMNATYLPAQKRLLFDFETIRNRLTDKSIDNIEGISFGPKLLNGNKTLILVSDNNFNKLGRQFNQFILLEIID